MDMAEYRAIPAVNWSTLSAMRESPAHYKECRDVGREDTPALLVGRAVDCAVFEPSLFPLRFACRPAGIDRRTKEGKTAWSEFLATNAGRDILDADEFDQVTKMAAAVRENAAAAPYLAGGFEQVVLRWTHRATGLACKARLDYVSHSRAVLLDLKSTVSTEHRKFAGSVVMYGYHNQLAFYRQGLETAAPAWKLPDGLCYSPILLAVEKTPPYDVAVFELEEKAMDQAARENEALLARVARCEERKTWPGRYDGHPHRLTLPPWAYDDQRVINPVELA